MPLSHQLRIGLIGGDAAASAHLRAYIDNPHIADVYLASTSEQPCAQLADRFGIIKAVFTDYHELVAEESVDVVDVCLPAHLCYPVVLAVLEAGKDVIVQVPPAATLAQFDEMVCTAASAGQQLFPVLWQRMVPAHQRAKELIETAVIGRVVLAAITVYGNELGCLNEAHKLRQTPAKTLRDATCEAIFHPVHMLQDFFGSPTAATGVIRPWTGASDKGPLDTAAAILELPGDVLGTITVSPAGSSTGCQQERKIVGTEGIILIRDDPEDVMPLIVINDDDFSPVKVHVPLRVRPWAIARTVDHFVDCILSDTVTRITADEARRALGTSLAIYQAAEQQVRIQVLS